MRSFESKDHIKESENSKTVCSLIYFSLSFYLFTESTIYFSGIVMLHATFLTHPNAGFRNIRFFQITCILNELIDPRGPESITVLRRSTGRRFTSSIGYFTPDIVKVNILRGKGSLKAKDKIKKTKITDSCLLILFINNNIQSTPVISNSKGLTETLRDIRTSTYQSWESEANNKLNNHI